MFFGHKLEIENVLNWKRNEPKSDGKSTAFGAGVCISAAIGPRRTVGVHGLCSNPAPIFEFTKFSCLFCAWNVKSVSKNYTHTQLIYGPINSSLNYLSNWTWTMTRSVKVISHILILYDCLKQSETKSKPRWNRWQCYGSAANVGAIQFNYHCSIVSGNIFKVWTHLWLAYHFWVFANYTEAQSIYGRVSVYRILDEKTHTEKHTANDA